MKKEKLKNLDTRRQFNCLLVFLADAWRPISYLLYTFYSVQKKKFRFATKKTIASTAFLAKYNQLLRQQFVKKMTIKVFFCMYRFRISGKQS